MVLQTKERNGHANDLDQLEVFLDERFPESEGRIEQEISRIPETNYIFLAKLLALKRATAYDVWRQISDEGGNSDSSLALPLHTSYRVAKQLAKGGLIRPVDLETRPNGMKKQYYEITEEGVRVLGGEARRMLNLAARALRGVWHVEHEVEGEKVQ